MIKSMSTALVLALAMAAPAQSDGEAEPHRFRGLVGDPGGVRSWLRARGLATEITYTADHFWNLKGGIRTRNSRRYRGDISLTMEFDPSIPGLWEGGFFFAHLQEEHGHTISDHVGDWQGLSSIGADDFKQLSQLWYLQSLGRFWFKVGKQEMNDDFVTTPSAGEFINPSAGLIPNAAVDTYPDQGWGVAMGVKATRWFSLAMGIFEGRPDGGRSLTHTLDDQHGPFLIVEPSFRHSPNGLEGNFRLGAWHNGANLDRLDGTRAEGNQGLYLIMDQRFYKENLAGDDEQGLSLFFQYGWAPKDRNEVVHYLGGGLQWQGLLPGRDDDVLGLGMFHARFSPRAAVDEPYERVIEFFYRAQCLSWLSLKPALQYVVNPGGIHRDALAAGVRLEVVF